MVDPAPAPGAGAGAKGQVRIEEPDRAERAVARRSAETRATVPDLDLSIDVDMGACLELGASQPGTVIAMLTRACALALRDFPRANGAYRDGRLELYSRVNIGVTVAAPDIYATPTVFDCDRKSLEELGREISDLALRAGAGELAAPELAGATFTLSHPGELGVAAATPVLVAPQAAAVAAGAIRDLAVVRNETVVPGHAMTITLVCDHRILYGWHAARFLEAIGTRLERPSF